MYKLYICTYIVHCIHVHVMLNNAYATVQCTLYKLINVRVQIVYSTVLYIVHVHVHVQCTLYMYM